MAGKLKQKTFWGTFWSVLDTILNRGITFIIGIILARILSPSDFGLVGMMMVFTAICDTFIESGISNALIRKLDRTDVDFNTAFICNLSLSIIAYAILYFSSPSIAYFYKEPQLEILIRVFGLNIILTSLCIVPNAIIVSSFRLKDLAKINFCANTIAGIIALISALKGAEVWSIVIQPIIANVVRIFGFGAAVSWHFTPKFSYLSLKYLIDYGSKSLLIGLLGTFFNNLYNLLIGKFFTKVDLGLFTRANQFGQMPIGIIQSAFQRVSVATFANLQYDQIHLKEVYRKYIHIISFIVFPSLFIMSVLAKPMILLMLTEKWVDCVVIQQIICIGLAFSPLGIINLCLLQAINRIDYSLKLEIQKKIVYLIIIFVTFPMGLIPMVLGASAYNIIGTLMNLSCSKKFINYSYKEQLSDIGLYLIIVSITSFTSYIFISLTDLSILLQLIIGGIIFLGIYIILSIILRVKAVGYIKEIKSITK